MVKLKQLIESAPEPQAPSLTSEEMRNMVESIKSFNSYRNQLKSTSVHEAVARISNSVALAERYSLSALSEGEWMEAKMISGDMKEMKKLSETLFKESSKLKEVEQQMEMIYEQIGLKLERYFQMDNDEPVHTPPENLIPDDKE